jgi:hypothetical protein
MTAPDRAGRRAAAAERTDGWDAVVRPRLMTRYAYGIAAVIAVSAVLVGMFNNHSTGAYFRTADQIAIACVGIIIAASVLLLTRPRLRIGPTGLSIRNILGDQLIPWSRVVATTFPPGARWARVDLPDDEYVAVLAIQSLDRELAVEAMDTLRRSAAKYRRRDAGPEPEPGHR